MWYCHGMAILGQLFITSELRFYNLSNDSDNLALPSFKKNAVSTELSNGHKTTLSNQKHHTRGSITYEYTDSDQWLPLCRMKSTILHILELRGTSGNVNFSRL